LFGVNGIESPPYYVTLGNGQAPGSLEAFTAETNVPLEQTFRPGARMEISVVLTEPIASKKH